MQEEEKDIRQFVLLRSCSTDFVLVVYCFETILLIFGSRGTYHTTALIFMGVVRLMQVLCVLVFASMCPKLFFLVFCNFIVTHSPFPFQFFLTVIFCFLTKIFFMSVYIPRKTTISFTLEEIIL